MIFQKMVSAFRRVMGMPDYPGYVEHLRACHPERAVPSEKEFYEAFLVRRYGAGANRCC
jgi:uncharacterized short protein YbdD (DUF466 family)